MRPYKYKWRDVWQQENHTLVLMTTLIASGACMQSSCRVRTLSSQVAISVSNGRVWVWLFIGGRGGRQAARAGQGTKERKVNIPCLLSVYFLITAHPFNKSYTWRWLQVCLAWAVHRVDGSRQQPPTRSAVQCCHCPWPARASHTLTPRYMYLQN